MVPIFNTLKGPFFQAVRRQSTVAVCQNGTKRAAYEVFKDKSVWKPVDSAPHKNTEWINPNSEHLKEVPAKVEVNGSTVDKTVHTFQENSGFVTIN